MAEGVTSKSRFNDHSIHPAIAVVEWRRIGLAKRLFVKPSFSHERFFEENTIMAVKKVAIGSPAAPTKADEELVQEAYGEARRNDWEGSLMPALITIKTQRRGLLMG